MKVMIDVISLCESAAHLVGATPQIFKKRRSKGQLTSANKIKSIVDAIMADPKKFTNFSMETLLALSGMSQAEVREAVRLAVKTLGMVKYKTKIQSLVFEIDDERVLRGELSTKLIT